MADGSAMPADPAPASQKRNPLDDYHANKSGQAFLDATRELEKNWLHTAQTRGVWRLWWLIYCAVLGINPRTGQANANQELRFAGPDDSYAQFRVQLMRRYIQQRTMMVKDQRPAFEGVATNSDADSLAQVNTATRAIEYALKEAHLEQEGSEALDALGSFGGAALLTTWNYDGGDWVDVQEPDIGEDGKPIQMPALDPQGNPQPQLDPQGQPVLHPETGEPMPQMQTQMRTVKKRSGCAKVTKLYGWQYVVDTYQEKDHPWCIVKIPVNKYELAAQLPELADKIIAATIDDEMGDDALFAWGGRSAVGSDTVVMRIYYHRKCTAVPDGRVAYYLKNVPLWGCDDPLPCPLDEGIPVKPMIGPRYFMTAFGYPESGDLLALQTVLNEVISMCVTNIQKRGNPNAYKRDDVQIDPTAFSMGGGLFDLPGGAEPPKWDEPPKMDTLSQFILQFVLDQAKQILGSNSVVDGNPDANITSGAFAVLLVNIAQKYASQMQEAYDTCITASANDCLELMKKNALNGFWAEIGGIGNMPYRELMKPEDLRSVRRVQIVRKNPVLSTYVGRRDVFDATVGLPPRQRQAALEMLLNSNTESFAEDDQASAIRIRKENERMLQGIAVKVGVTDDHVTEGPKHRMMLDKLRTMDPPTDPAAYAQWEASCNLLDQHIQEHGLALATTPAPLAMVCGWAPMPVPEPQNQQGGGAGGNKPGKQPKQPNQPQAPQPPEGASGIAA